MMFAAAEIRSAKSPGCFNVTDKLIVHETGQMPPPWPWCQGADSIEV
jgi:hypothetical protein